MNIVIYTGTNCMGCNMTKKFFKENGVDFEERNVEDPTFLAQAKETGFNSIPIVVTNDDVFVGFRPDKLKAIAKNFNK